MNLAATDSSQVLVKPGEYKLDKNTGIIFRNYNSVNNLKSIIGLKNFCKKNTPNTPHIYSF